MQLSPATEPSSSQHSSASARARSSAASVYDTAAPTCRGHATETPTHVLQTSPTAYHENVLRSESQPGRQGPQATGAENGTRKTHPTGLNSWVERSCR